MKSCVSSASLAYPVVNASVMPDLVGGNINAPVATENRERRAGGYSAIMIAEKTRGGKCRSAHSQQLLFSSITLRTADKVSVNKSSRGGVCLGSVGFRARC